MDTIMKTTVQDCGKELPIQFPILNITLPTGIHIKTLYLGIMENGIKLVSIPYLGKSHAMWRNMPQVYTKEATDKIVYEIDERITRLQEIVASQEAIITYHEDRLSNIERYLLKLVEEEAEGKKLTPWKKYKESKQ